MSDQHLKAWRTRRYLQLVGRGVPCDKARQLAQNGYLQHLGMPVPSGRLSTPTVRRGGRDHIRKARAKP